MINPKLHLISPCRFSPAQYSLLVQNCALKHHAFINSVFHSIQCSPEVEETSIMDELLRSSPDSQLLVLGGMCRTYSHQMSVYRGATGGYGHLVPQVGDGGGDHWVYKHVIMTKLLDEW